MAFERDVTLPLNISFCQPDIAVSHNSALSILACLVGWLSRDFEGLPLPSSWGVDGILIP
jgi:hypothetical protein